MEGVLGVAHLLAAVLASWRLTELVTMDRITEPLRRRWPIYLWTCPRCVSVWAGIAVTLCLVFAPWLNWPLALAWFYLVQKDNTEAWRRHRWQQRHHGRTLRPIAGGSAADVYIADVAAGTDDGSSCANAHAVSFFNTAANWGAGAGQIGAGTTVHLCGTFTGTAGSTKLITQGSGSAGNPIMIVFEIGASLTAPYWSTTGAFQINHNYITVDGLNRGTDQITATANGPALANQVDSEGLHIGEVGAPHDVEIRNLSITNMCVRSQNDANTTCTGNAIKLVAGGGNILIHGNVLHDVVAGVNVVVSITESGDQIYANTIYNRDAGIIYAACANGISITNTLIHDNDIGSSANWDDPADNFHHDGIHLFNCAGTTGTISVAKLYNNYVHGAFGAHSTAGIFLEDSWAGILTFDNVIAPASGAVTDGCIFYRGGGGGGIYNNTIVGGGPGIGLLASPNNLVKNNVLSGSSTVVNVEDDTSKTGLVIDFNDEFNGTQWAWGTTGIFSTFAAWQTGSGEDASSVTGDPTLNATYHLQTGSAAIGRGVNLSGLGVSQLNSDKDGVARPGSGAWDAGAYQFAEVPAIPGKGGGHRMRVIRLVGRFR